MSQQLDQPGLAKIQSLPISQLTPMSPSAPLEDDSPNIGEKGDEQRQGKLEISSNSPTGVGLTVKWSRSRSQEVPETQEKSKMQSQ